MTAKTTRRRTAGAAVLAALTVGACGEGLSVETNGAASVRLLLTDAPVDYVESAMVDIGRVELVPYDGGGHIVLSDDGTDGPVDLLDLQNSVTMILADADIEAGGYSQLRLIVESASVELVSPYVFTDGDSVMDLTVPSGAQTGIKLNLTGPDGEPLEIPEGETVLVVDFDVSRSFRIQGNPDTPAGIKGMHFQPTLRVVVFDAAGSISGTVSTDLDSTRVDSLTVTAEPVDEGDLELYQTQAATTMTDSLGAYTLRFLVPGSYTVTVTPPDSALATDPDSASVTLGVSEHITDVDFSIIDPS
jgi:hypothetical protein